MHLVDNKKVPPKEWEHDAKISDKEGNTVAVYLLKSKL